MNEMYNKLNLRFIMAFFCFCMVRIAMLHGQSDPCIIRTELEPNLSVLVARSVSTFQFQNDSLAQWSNLDAGNNADGNLIAVEFDDVLESQVIECKGFYADVPLGATILGVQLRITGKSTDRDAIQENLIQFYLDGVAIGDNFAGKSIILNPWKEEVHDWEYGYNFSDWGMNWTREILRSPELSIRISISSIDEDNLIEAFIDNVELVVHYIPLYTLCSDHDVVAYSDEIVNATQYIWNIPPNVKYQNEDPENRVIDLDFSEADYGLLDIGLRVLTINDTLECDRTFLHNACKDIFVGDLVWLDDDYDGIQGGLELGLEGIELSLYDPYGSVIDSVISDEDGRYEFKIVDPGFYYIELEVNQYVSAPQNIGLDFELDSDLSENYRSHVFYVSGEEDMQNLDFGLFEPRKITGNVWEECDEDGIMNGGDQNSVNTVIQLWKDGEILDIDTTDVNGDYEFTGLRPGLYRLKIITDEKISVYNSTGNSSVENDFLVDGTLDVVIVAGEDIIGADAAIYLTSKLEISLFFDENKNEILDDGENIFDSQWIFLYEDNQMIDSSIVVDGFTVFEDLGAGVYQWRFSYDGLYIIEGNDDYSIFVENDMYIIHEVLLDCFVDNSLELIAKKSGARIGDFVWYDIDEDGLQGDDETGIEGVDVFLYDIDDLVVSFVETDENGFYEFQEIPDGSYYIEFQDLNTDYQITLEGEDPEKGSKVLFENGRYVIPSFEVENGDVILNKDAGFIATLSTIGDFVWIDNNSNGVQDPNEKGLKDVKIELYGVDDILIKTTESDGEGSYQFSVFSGDYYLRFSHEKYTNFTLFDSNVSDEVNSDIDPINGNSTAIFQLDNGEVKDNIDVGFLPKTAIVGDFVFLDLDQDGIQGDDEIGLNDFVVEAFTESGLFFSSVLTDVNGFYQLELAEGDYYLKFSKDGFMEIATPGIGADDKDSDVTGANGFGTTDIFTILEDVDLLDIDAGFFTIDTRIGDFVWNDANSDGVQGATEIGLGNIEVNLVKIGEGIVGTMMTNDGSNGNLGEYGFLVDQPGEYYLEFFLPSDDYSFTDSDILDDEKDSDVSFGNGFGTTDVFNVMIGEDILDIDAGMIVVNQTPFAIIGDKVWQDLNKNGIFESVENGMANVFIELIDEDGNTVGGIESDNEGYYSFSDVIPGNYTIFCELPDDYEFTLIDNASDDETDSDVKENGYSEVFSVVAGEEKTNLDIGLFPMDGIISGITWVDFDGDGVIDDSEHRLDKVIVELYANDGDKVAVCKSNNGGVYSFSDLVSDAYYLEFKMEAPFGISSIINDHEVHVIDGLFDGDFSHSVELTDTKNININAAFFFDEISASEYMDIDVEDYTEHTNIVSWKSIFSDFVDVSILERRTEHGEWKEIYRESNVNANWQEYEDQLNIYLQGHVGYRLRQVTLDDKEVLSSEKWVWDNEESYFVITPNPSSNRTVISFELSERQELTIQMFMLDGELIETIFDYRMYEAGAYEKELILDNLKPGVYILKYQSADKISCERLIFLK